MYIYMWQILGPLLGHPWDNPGSTLGQRGSPSGEWWQCSCIYWINETLPYIYIYTYVYIRTHIYIYIYMWQFLVCESEFPPPNDYGKNIDNPWPGLYSRQQTCLFCDRADMSAVWHSRHGCWVTQQKCLLGDTPDMSAVWQSRHVCCVTQATGRHQKTKFVL